MNENVPISDQFREACDELVKVKKEIDEANGILKILKERRANLETFVGGYMKAQEIDDVKLKSSDARVVNKTTVRKPTVTKKMILEELANYIQGGMERIQEIIKEIEGRLSPTEKSSLQLKLKKSPKE
jgi:hypothetical protein